MKFINFSLMREMTSYGTRVFTSLPSSPLPRTNPSFSGGDAAPAEREWSPGPWAVFPGWWPVTGRPGRGCAAGSGSPRSSADLGAALCAQQVRRQWDLHLWASSAPAPPGAAPCFRDVAHRLGGRWPRWRRRLGWHRNLCRVFLVSVLSAGAGGARAGTAIGHKAPPGREEDTLQEGRRGQLGRSAALS